MKLTVRTTGLLSVFGLLTANWFVTPVMAQCVQADVSVQYNISGSKEPTERTNDVEMSQEGTCRGNASVTTGVQGNVGGTRQVRQTRVVRHRIENRDNSHRYSGGSTIQIQSNPAIDVYNPADNLDY
ncbi:hypothetical protein I4641_11005 [Waterburya agarophytonicola K14]|uniref:Uncharacterized protein n=1 Tax=Waterburya agarophytonicola KI4 TaxID=2874699 RepID=A0A964FG04_9CYAN|nr:hypothetical protein [Waterburya agarophytonicola]MCC0177506.1 hypothetical protein [Waterburya agarophytonicola KI4]